MGLIIGGVSAHDLILDGSSVSLYVGGSPPVKVWPTRETVQITLGHGMEARDQFRAALTARGLDYTTVTELPFNIELVGSGNAQHLFYGCSALTSIPPFDMSQVTNANGMFQMCGSLVTVPPLDTRNVWNAPSMFAYCRSLTSVPTMDAAKMTNVTFMFYGCSSLTDGNVLLTNRHPAVTTTNMIGSSGLTREPWGTATAPVARKVTINGSASGWNQATATGDTGLIQEWTGKNRVRFHAPTKCNQQVYNATSGLVVVNAGNTIPAGAPVQPITYNGPYIFTEVL